MALMVSGFTQLTDRHGNILFIVYGVARGRGQIEGGWGTCA